MTLTIEALNVSSAQDAYDFFMQTCTASKWCELMQKSRPFDSVKAVKHAAKRHWQSMQKEDYLEAFAGHPMIGDITTLRAKYANTKAMAAGEQSGVNEASESTLLALNQANQRYYQKHGFIFIICASGLNADTMLAAIEARLANDTPTELKAGAAEQLNITLLRLDKALASKPS